MFFQRPFSQRRWIRLSLIILAIVGLFVVVGLYWRTPRINNGRIQGIRTWLAEPDRYPDWQVDIGIRCGDAPMLIPTSGYIGVAWGDGARPLYQHSGFDIFGPDPQDNVTPIIAAYDGFLTRESNWRSTVIIRHPDFRENPGVDALEDGDTIWTYYTHMASADGGAEYISPEFPRGTFDKFVTAGTILGYQGTWSGDPNRRMGRHLHFSVVKSTSSGGYANETVIANTYDPAPFLGVTLDEGGIYRCLADKSSEFTTGQKTCSKRKQTVQCHYFGYTQHKSEWVSEA